MIFNAIKNIFCLFLFAIVVTLFVANAFAGGGGGGSPSGSAAASTATVASIANAETATSGVESSLGQFMNAMDAYSLQVQECEKITITEQQVNCKSSARQSLQKAKDILEQLNAQAAKVEGLLTAGKSNIPKSHADKLLGIVASAKEKASKRMKEVEGAS